MWFQLENIIIVSEVWKHLNSLNVDISSFSASSSGTLSHSIWFAGCIWHRTPGSVPHCGTCLCSYSWDQIPQTCHMFTRLFTSNTPWYFLGFALMWHRRTHGPAIHNWRFYQAVFLWACLIAPTIFRGGLHGSLIDSFHLCMNVLWMLEDV